ncbi:Rne/Rng family ribonuclease [Arthrobacter sp. TMN-49]
MNNEQPTFDAAEAAAAVPAKAPRSRRATAAVTSPAQAPAAVSTEAGETAAATNAPAKKAPARRNRAKKDPAPADAVPAPEAAAPETAAAPVKRATRRRATAPVTAPVAIQGELSLAGDEAAPEAPAAKAPARRTRATKAAAATAAPSTEAVVEAAQEPVTAPATKTKAPRRATRKAAAPAAEVPVQGEMVLDAGAESAAQDATAQAPAAPKTTRSRRRSAVEKSAPAAETPVASPAVTADAAPVEEPLADDAAEPAVTDSLFMAPSSGMSTLFMAPDMSRAVPAVAAQDDNADRDDVEQDNDGDRRGRARGRNRRTRATEPDAAPHDDDASTEPESDAPDDGVTSRRRRRRRRGDADLELTGGTDEDPPNTVTRVRAPRTPAEPSDSASNRVTSLRGSTRLEAKKQRRRDSRDSGRRRTVITEAEFLARRESVDRVMVVRQSDDRIQIGVLEDGILAEHFVSKTQQDSLIGNVYLGKVQNVLPSMEAAFVDIGRGRNAVLYAGEVDWDAANLNGQPRRIENALKSGDSVLVQVSKDPVGHKGARLTSQISLPGRYLVFVPGGSMTGISRKLPDVERNRLKRVLKDHLPENAGVIVRTAAEGASEEELTNDINRLRAQWEGINNRASSHKTLAPEMLYAEPDLTIKVVRDVFNEDFSKLVVSGEDAWDTIEAYVTYVAPDLLDRLEKWTKNDDIFAVHRIDEQISKALERKVFLPSGGSLVIDRTEAMTVVDVNTGKFTGSGGNLEETVTKNNLEAAEEVVRQLRLRDIGGIIVIDFIDMVLESNRDLVSRRLVECLGRDRTKHQVAEVTSLGLVQMTRKRMGTGLLEVFGEQCGTCAGRGMVTHEIPVEHRRVHTVAVESPQAQAAKVAQEQRDGDRTANRSTRSERKRNRNRSKPESELAEHAPVEVHEEPTDEQKAQKAHEARAALANIAAAAAASHHERHAESPAPASAPGSAQGGSEDSESDDAATLTLGGEAIELPRGHRTESSGFAEASNADQAAALAGLTQALDQLLSPGQEQSAADAGEEGGNSRSRSRRGRRNRSARSAQGGADTAVETTDSSATAQGSTQHSSAAVELPAATRPAKSSEPIILGVGVPASEL